MINPPGEELFRYHADPGSGEDKEVFFCKVEFSYFGSPGFVVYKKIQNVFLFAIGNLVRLTDISGNEYYVNLTNVLRFVIRQEQEEG